MRRFPTVVGGATGLGILALGGGVYLVFANCSSAECVNTTVGAVLIALGLLGILSVIPNMVGLVCFLSTVCFAIFLGLVFLFARQPAGLLPPLVMAALAFAEQDLLRRYYARASQPRRTTEAS